MNEKLREIFSNGTTNIKLAPVKSSQEEKKAKVIKKK